MVFWTPVYPRGVLIILVHRPSVVCWSVCQSVFKYLRDHLLFFYNFLHEVSGTIIVWHIGPAPLGNMPEKISLVFSAPSGSVLSQIIGGQQKKNSGLENTHVFLNYAIIMCQKTAINWYKVYTGKVSIKTIQMCNHSLHLQSMMSFTPLCMFLHQLCIKSKRVI